MTVIYLGMALSGTPEWWHKRFHRMVVRQLEYLHGVSVSRFVGLDPEADPTYVHDYDLGLAQSADRSMPSVSRVMSVSSTRPPAPIAAPVLTPALLTQSKLPDREKFSHLKRRLRPPFLRVVYWEKLIWFHYDLVFVFVL